MSSMTIRLFYALALGTDASQALQLACGRIREEVPFARWTHPADYHITVKFIGDVEPSLADELAHPVQAASAGTGPIELTLRSMNVFGRPASPAILWCGTDGALDQLRSLHERVDRAAASCGIARDERPYQPHITVARKYKANEPFTAVKPKLEALAPAPVSWLADELVLYRTRFGSRPAYEAIQRIPL